MPWPFVLDAARELGRQLQRHLTSRCCDRGVLAEIAALPQAPADLVTALLNTRSWEVHLALSANSSLRWWMLWRLAEDEWCDFSITWRSILVPRVAS